MEKSDKEKSFIFFSMVLSFFNKIIYSSLIVQTDSPDHFVYKNIEVKDIL